MYFGTMEKGKKKLVRQLKKNLKEIDKLLEKEHGKNFYQLSKKKI